MAEVTKVDEWVPDYTRECEVCGQRPVVTGIQYRFDADNLRDRSADRVVYKGTMCGVCTWGEADCLDPANW